MFIPEHILNIVCNADNYIDGGVDKEVWNIPQEVYEEFFCNELLDIPSGIFPELEDYFAKTSPRFDLVLVLNKNKNGNIYTDELIASRILLGYSFECDTFFTEDRYDNEFSTTSGYVMEKLRVGQHDRVWAQSTETPEIALEQLNLLDHIRKNQFSCLIQEDKEILTKFFSLFPEYKEIDGIECEYYFDARYCNVGISKRTNKIVLFDAFRHNQQYNDYDLFENDSQEYSDEESDMEIDFDVAFVE